MSSNVIDLDEHRPHVVVEGLGRSHVVPLELIEKLINGTIAFADVEDQDLLRDILHSWLEMVS